MVARKTAEVPANRSNAPMYVAAYLAEPGKPYVNWQLTMTMVCTGKAKEVMGATEYEFTCKHRDGDALMAWLPKFYPLWDDLGHVGVVGQAHEAKAARMAGRTGAKAATVEDPVTGETRPIIKEARLRASLDPRTGCTPGTSAHRAGTIMLDQKPGGDHRPRCIALMVKQLGMEKPLAASWYSTLARRKPEIYAK